MSSTDTANHVKPPHHNTYCNEGLEGSLGGGGLGGDGVGEGGGGDGGGPAGRRFHT